MNYKDIDDNELVFMISENDSNAKDLAFSKYKYIIDIYMHKYYNASVILGIDYHDLYQDAMLGFADGLTKYRSDKYTSLPTFLNICVERKIKTTLRNANTLKNKANQESISLEHTYNENTVPLMYSLSDNNENNPLINMEKNETIEELEKKIMAVLSEGEIEVYHYLVKELNYIEIAKILDKTPKQIDNTIQRIRNKVKTIINSD